jgi:hypothetical protein
MKTLGNVMVMGDSISTFRGYTPEGTRSYYGIPELNLDVNKVEQTWWWQLIEKTNSKLILNSSFSGATVCTTECNNWEMTGSAFVYRINTLIHEDFFKRNKIDSFFIFGGTNDSWYNSPVGQIKHQDISQEDLKYVLPAFSYLIDRVKKESPNTKIYLIINTGLKEEIANGIKDIAEHFDQVAIELKDIDKIAGHPSRKGMTQIAEQILERL